MERQFRTVRAGTVDYATALALQERLLAARRSGDTDLLLLLEHPPVVTLGRGTTPGQLRHPAPALEAQGIAVHTVSRGGGATFHGPGQLVGYPIVDLQPLGRDLHRFLRQLEAVLGETLAALGVVAAAKPGRTGLWVGNDKIAAIGVAVRHWISWHGFALNLAGELQGFRSIVPCGLSDAGVTSVETVTGRRPDRAVVEELIIAAFARTFACQYAGEYDGDRSAKA